MLRLFTDEGSVDAPLSIEQQRRWTLAEAYENTLREDQKRNGTAKSTIVDYCGTLRRWDEWLRQTSSTLSISQITEDDLNLFGDWLEVDRTGRTVNKHLGNVEAILRRCGPKGPNNRTGRQIIDEFLFAERRDESEDTSAVVRVVPREAFEQIYGACRVAKRPSYGRTPPPLTWRSIMLLFWTFGPRRNDAFKMSSASVSFDPVCPLQDLRIEHQWGWLSWTPRKTKRRKRRPLVLPLTRGLHAHFKQIEGRGDRFFPFNGSFRSWREQFNAIQRSAGIEEPYTFKEFRKTANVEWDSLPGEYGIGSHVLGHAPRDVNTKHYKQAVRKLVELVDSFPLSDRMPD